MDKKQTVAADQDAAEFVSYYAQQSVTPEAQERSQRIYDVVTKLIARPGETLDVADIGCGPGAQSMVWALAGHRVSGLDVNEGLLELARQRSAEAGLEIEFRAGTAEALPYADASVDVCLAPELLEHVPNWQVCLREFARILKPGGVMYLSTTNRLCPVQMEYELPLYSWYPAPLKRRYERLAVTTRRELVNYATYPAVHWFTFYELRDFLKAQGVSSLDRFDMIESDQLGTLPRLAVRTVRAVPPLRWLGHVMTPYTNMLGIKQSGSQAAPGPI